MEISSLPSQIVNLINRSVKADPGKPSGGGSSAGAVQTLTPNTPPASGATSQVRDILSHYDFQQISPREFSEMVQKLQEAGAVSDGDAKELAQMRMEMDLAQASPDDPIDLVDFFSRKMKDQQNQADNMASKNPGGFDRNAYLAPTQRQLQWVQKFAAIQSSAATEEINALA